MVIDDIVINKSTAIRACLERIAEEFDDSSESLKNITKCDAITLNLQRACEAAIDLAMHVVKVKSLGVPQKSRDAFDLLEQGGYLELNLSEKMKKMIGFRNIAIHQYQILKVEILESIIRNDLSDFEEFVSAIKNIDRE